MKNKYFICSRISEHKFRDIETEKVSDLSGKIAVFGMLKKNDKVDNTNHKNCKQYDIIHMISRKSE